MGCIPTRRPGPVAGSAQPTRTRQEDDDLLMPHTDRSAPVTDANEFDMLTGWLDHHRETLELKCAGLDEEQLKTRSVPPSSLSLLGLVRHMVDVERGWFRRTMLGEDVPPVYHCDARPDGEFDDVQDGDVEADLAAWRAECDHSRRIVSGCTGLDQRSVGRDGGFNLRWVMTHMIEEYARHNGHADLLRERIDGATGA
jgi:uncharacterized damage-inducible protein DinB